MGRPRERHKPDEAKIDLEECGLVLVNEQQPAVLKIRESVVARDGFS